MIKVAIGESSYIIRKGIIQLLNEFNEIDLITEYSDAFEFEKKIHETSPDLVIVNPSFYNGLNLPAENANKNLLILHLFNSILPASAPKSHLSVFENKADLIEKLSVAIKALKPSSNSEKDNELTPREKLVLKQVALGKTNKEIGDKLFISTHTVISHRKNITRKLDIKTVSGLTVYAILNQLLSIEDIS